MNKHLVIVGAGHAHMTVLKNLAAFVSAGHRVTVVGPGRYHYYSGMGPGMLSGIYRPDEIRFEVRDMALRRGASFVEDRVVHVDPARRRLHLEQSAPIDYDVVSFNTGSGVPLDPAFHDTDALVPVKPIENLMRARGRIIQALNHRGLSLVVAGGGAAGLEVAANLRRLVEDAQGQATVTLAAGDRLLRGMPTRVRARARQKLARRDVRLIEGSKVLGFRDGSAGLSSGEPLPCDFLFMAVGVRPSSLFMDSGLLTGADGGLLVNPHLQSAAHPEIFGGGDCISFGPRPLPKVGVYAVRQNPILFRNLQRTLQGGDLLPFRPQRRYLLAFNMGDGTAIVSWHGLVFDGRLGFALKNYLDRSFMRNFQDKLEAQR